MTLKLECVAESPEGLVKTQVAGLVGPTPALFNFERLGWSSKCAFKQVPTR